MASMAAQRDSRHGWLAGAFGSLGVFVVLTAFVMWHCLDGIDQCARSFVHQLGPPSLRPFMEACSFWGGQAGQSVAVVLLAALAFWHGRRRWALSLPIIMAGAGLLQLLAKWAADRPRPNLDHWGFPSAHVLSLVVLCGCVAYLIRTSNSRRAWRWCGNGGCAVLVFTVAYSRMYLDAHWLSDVLGGLSIGVAYLLFAIWVQVGHAAPEKRGGAADMLTIAQSEAAAATS